MSDGHSEVNDPVTTDFVVLGERRDDPSKLLLRGDDGELYVYDLGTAHVMSAEADENWTLDARSRAPERPAADSGSADAGAE